MLCGTVMTPPPGAKTRRLGPGQTTSAHFLEIQKPIPKTRAVWDDGVHQTHAPSDDFIWRNWRRNGLRSEWHLRRYDPQINLMCSCRTTNSSSGAGISVLAVRQPGSRLVEGLIFCLAVGVIWLGTEIFQKKKPKEDE